LNLSSLKSNNTAQNKLKEVIAKALGNISVSDIYLIIPSNSPKPANLKFATDKKMSSNYPKGSAIISAEAISQGVVLFEIRLIAQLSGFSDGSNAYSAMTSNIKKSGSIIQNELLASNFPIFQAVTINTNNMFISPPVFVSIRTASPSYSPST